MGCVPRPLAGGEQANTTCGLILVGDGALHPELSKRPSAA
jgi:hypothetical protein